MLSPRRRRWRRRRRRRRRRRCRLNLYMQGLSSDTIALKLYTLIQDHLLTRYAESHNSDLNFD